MELMLTGDRIPAEQALALGLANRVLDAGSSARGNDETCGQTVERDRRSRLRRSSVLFGRVLAGRSTRRLDRERTGQTKLLQSGDCMEGIMAWMQKA